MPQVHLKASGSHPRAAEVEAAGLRWLASAENTGGPRVVRLLEVQPEALRLEEIDSARVTRTAAEDFGRSLARMHTSLWPGEHDEASCSHMPFGQLPPEHPSGVPPLFGPADQLLEMGSGLHRTWGAFQAAERLSPVLQKLRGVASDAEWSLLLRAQDRIATGEFDGDEPPSLLHGDLWSGNVLWSPGGAVLIDPAAHTGHRESDIALLELFGLPKLDRVLAGYQAQAALAPGWQARVPVHQLFYLAAHWLLFGEFYRNAALRTAEQILILNSSNTSGARRHEDAPSDSAEAEPDGAAS